MKKRYPRKLKKLMKKNGSWHTRKWTLDMIWNSIRYQIGYNMRQTIDYGELWGTSVFDYVDRLMEKSL